MTPFLIAYLALCLAAGYVGRNRRFGFWGYLFLSLLFSPLLGFLFVFTSAKLPKEL